jgi:hypothetical protein
MEKIDLTERLTCPSVVTNLHEYLKISQGSLPSLQEPPVNFIPSQFNPTQNKPSHLFKIHFNIILQITTRFSKWSFYFEFQSKTLDVFSSSSLFKTHPSSKNSKI